MEAGGGSSNSGKEGRERRRREGIKRVVLKRGEASDAAGSEEPRLGTAENPEILEEPMSTVEKRLREQLEALGGEEFRQRRTVSWRDEDQPERNVGEYRVPSRQDLKDGDEYMYTQTEFKEGEFPQWAQAYRDAAKNDDEIAKLLDGALDDPKEMQARMEERLSKNKSEILQEKTGAAEPPQIVFKNFDPFDLNIWIQLYKQPSDDDADLLAGILRSWYMLGKIGAYNSANLQVSDREELLDLQKDEKNQASAIRYDTRPAPGESKVMLKTYLHNIGDLEFQNEWGKLWIDLGTSDALALDVLLNALLKFSDDYVGIKQIIFGGQLETWDGMMDKEDKEYMKIVI